MSVIKMKYFKQGVRYYYAGKYITKDHARSLIIKGNPMEIDCIEPYPIEIKLELTRLEHIKELYEAREQI